MILACSAILLLIPPAAARNRRELAQEGREQLRRQAPTCDKAKVRFGDCAYGVGGDISLGQIVTEKCERTFLQQLSAGQRSTYDREMKRCGEHLQEHGQQHVPRNGGGLAQSCAHKFGKARSR